MPQPWVAARKPQVVEGSGSRSSSTRTFTKQQGFPAKVRTEGDAAVDTDAAEARRAEEARASAINLGVAWGLVLICCRYALAL